MIKQHLQHTIHAAVSEMLTDQKNDTPITQHDIELTHPDNIQFGDYATNIALKLAKPLKQNPMTIAEHIIKHIKSDDIVNRAEAVKPGFINIFFTQTFLLKELKKAASNNLITPPIGKDKTVIVEFSSPNIAKPFTIGHLRSTIIGNAIANILEASGYTVKRDNHLGDWGTQFGKQIYAIKTWGNEKEIEQAEKPVKLLVDLYVKFHEQAEKNPTLEEEGRKWFKKLEDGDKEARELWQKCIDWSWKEFAAIYEKLGVTFTENGGRGFGESFFEDKMDTIIKELHKKNLLKESKGAQMVFFPQDTYPPMMIIKNDGATLYATRDLATDKFRLKHYGKNVMIINEVGAEQSLYFQQLFEIEKMAGWVTDEQRIHVKHGMYRFKDKKMSTRKGNVIWLEEVLQEAINRAQTLSKTNDSYLAEKIGIGSLIWNDLKRDASQNITFDWNDILNMQGNSGPYIIYTYVRTQSVIRKSETVETFHATSLPTTYKPNPEESLLLRTIYQYSEAIESAAAQFAPHHIATYIYTLAQYYNSFYQKCPIIKAQPEAQKLRAQITQAVSHILKHGLHLLGIETVEKM